MSYSFSDEIVKSPWFSVWKLNLESPLIQRIIRKQLQDNEKLVREYEPLYGAMVSSGSYSARDGNMLPYFCVESKRAKKKSPFVLYYHGGGFISPVTPQILDTACYFAAKLGIRVLIPDYRTSFDYPCKTILEDCYDMLLFTQTHADELGVDMAHMVFYGDSAGAALTAGMALMARDQNGPRPLAQMLIYPVADRHNEKKYFSIRQYKNAPWTANANRHMWNIYLKHGDGGLYSYAVPMSHPDHTNLPPAYVEPQEIDILRDEGIAYAKKLEKAGNEVRLNIVMGTYHGFDFDHKSPLVQRVQKERALYMKQYLFG